MTAPITGMYCDRCGARHDFARARPGGVARLRGLTRGVRGYVLNEAPTFNDAISDAWARLEEDGALEQDAEVQQTFSFCLDCRGYVCHECWNAEAGRCLTCVPLPGSEDQAGSLLAGRLDLVAGPAAGAPPPGEAAPPSVAEPAHAAPPAPVAEPAPAVPPDAGDEAIDSVDAVARLAGMGLAGGEPIASVPATPLGGTAAEVGLTHDGPPADAGPSTATPVDGATAAAGTRRPPRLHRHVRASAPAGAPVPSDEDADVIAAAVAAGIIVSPTPPAPPAETPAPPAAPPAEPPEPPAEPPAPAAAVAEVVAAPAETDIAAVVAAVGAAADVEAMPEVVAAPAGTDIAAVEAVPAWPTRTPAPTSPEVADAVDATTLAAPEPVAPERDLADEGPAAVPPQREPATATGPAAAPTGQTMAPGGSATPGRPRGRDRRRPAPPPRRIPSPVHCRHCGLQVPAVARFCRRCGGRQVEDATVVG